MHITHKKARSFYNLATAIQFTQINSAERRRRKKWEYTWIPDAHTRIKSLNASIYRISYDKIKTRRNEKLKFCSDIWERSNVPHSPHFYRCTANTWTSANLSGAHASHQLPLRGWLAWAESYPYADVPERVVQMPTTAFKKGWEEKQCRESHNQGGGPRMGWCCLQSHVELLPCGWCFFAPLRPLSIWT